MVVFSSAGAVSSLVRVPVSRSHNGDTTHSHVKLWLERAELEGWFCVEIEV
jgi:hypothetical protein